MKKNIKLYKFNEIDSTNEYLRKNHKSYEEFDVISARVQTHGKARRQNDWISLDGMALFSFFLKERDNWEIEDYLKLPLIAGIAVIKGLRKIENLEYKFKWTNDVYLENKKLCGILMEKIEEEYDLEVCKEYLKAKEEGTLVTIPFEEAIKEWDLE